VLEEVRHRRLRVRAALQLQHDPHVVGRLVAHVRQLRHVLLRDVVGNLLHNLALVHAVGDRLDDGAGLPLRPVAAPHLDGPLPRLVDLLDLLLGVQNLPSGREVRALDVLLHQGAARHVGLIDHVERGVDDLPQIVRRNIGGHPHRDAAHAVHQQIRHPRGQHHRLLHRAVKVGTVVHGVVAQLLQHLHGQRPQLRLRIPHRGGVVAVHGAKVAVPVHQRRPQREGLRHPHHGVVDGLVAVGVVLSHAVVGNHAVGHKIVVGGDL